MSTRPLRPLQVIISKHYTHDLELLEYNPADISLLHNFVLESHTYSPNSVILLVPHNLKGPKFANSFPWTYQKTYDYVTPKYSFMCVWFLKKSFFVVQWPNSSFFAACLMFLFPVWKLPFEEKHTWMLLLEDIKLTCFQVNLKRSHPRTLHLQNFEGL